MDTNADRHDDLCERIDVDIGVGSMSSPCGCKDREVMRLREALQLLYDEIADYIRINNLGDVHHNISMRMARDALGFYCIAPHSDGTHTDMNARSYPEPVDSSGGPIGADVAEKQSVLTQGPPIPFWRHNDCAYSCQRAVKMFAGQIKEHNKREPR